MIKLLRKIFKKKTAEIDVIADVNLACAILLIEVSYSDFNIDNKEINSIIKLFKTVYQCITICVMIYFG